MTPDAVTFDVVGIPMPQGSMKAFSAAGKARMKPSGGAGFAAWRNAVSDAAKRIADQRDAPMDGPLLLTAEFRFPLPASRPKRLRDAGIAAKTTAPDIDKLLRCLGDALTASGLIADDARISEVRAIKIETTGWTGATIGVRAA